MALSQSGHSRCVSLRVQLWLDLFSSTHSNPPEPSPHHTHNHIYPLSSCLRLLPPPSSSLGFDGKTMSSVGTRSAVWRLLSQSTASVSALKLFATRLFWDLSGVRSNSINHKAYSHVNVTSTCKFVVTSKAKFQLGYASKRVRSYIPIKIYT